MERRYDVLVIGGGQAGLAMGYHLARDRRSFLVLDAAPRVGEVWRRRWSSLRLFTPARYSGLPGLPFPADPDHLPGKEEVADYLESYASRLHLPVRSGEPVLRVRPRPGGGFEVETPRGEYEADQVVVATGPFQKSVLPPFARSLGPDVVQLHSSDYRFPAQLPSAGDVLVVGGGNSGVQIAAELAATRTTWLALGGRLPRVPERILGRSVFWWFEKLGALDVTVDSRLGRRASRREMLIGDGPATIARRLGVRLLDRAESASGRTVRAREGGSAEVAAVVWATGYRTDFPFLSTPAVDAAGRPVHRRGVSAVPGLYFLGLPWQHTRGSALLGWVGRDAAFLAERIAERTRSTRSALSLPRR